MENLTDAVDGMNATSYYASKYVIEYVRFVTNAVGFLLNVLAIVVVIRRPFIQSKISRMLVVNKCSADAIGALLSAVDTLSNDPCVPKNAIGDLICCLWWSDFLLWGFIQASVNGGMLFTVERYLSIAEPVIHKRLTGGFTYVAIVLSWIVGFIINVAFVYEAERNEDRCQATLISPIPYVVQGVITLLIYIFPLVLLIGLYSHMIIVLKRRNRQLRAARRNHRLNEVSRDLTITVAIATTAFTLLFAPETFIYAIHAFGVIHIDFSGWLNHLYTLFVDINFVVNPLVFVVFLRAFRRELRRLHSRF